MHVNENEFIVEVIDPMTEEATAPEAKGEWSSRISVDSAARSFAIGLAISCKQIDNRVPAAGRLFCWQEEYSAGSTT